MTEHEAKERVLDLVGEKEFERVASFLALVAEENQRQNLIAPSTVPTIWARHALDSLQLLAFAPHGATSWLDIGTGGGFPGLLIALVAPFKVTLSEPRRRRADFLSSCVDHFGLVEQVDVRRSAVEQLDGQYEVISARAVSSVRKLLHGAAHCGTNRTCWILPRGKLTEDDTLVLRQRQAMFHVEQSITDVSSAILVVERIEA